MSTESGGFAPEPVYPLAEKAEIGQLRERLYAAQNALVRRDAEIARLADERAGKVLVDPEDLRLILPGYDSVTTVNAATVRAAWDRLYDAAGTPARPVAERTEGAAPEAGRIALSDAGTTDGAP